MKNPNNPPTRRSFLTRSAAGLAGLAAGPVLIPGHAWGRAGSTFHNSKVNMGMIGVGDMGTSHLRRILALDDVRVVAICDVRREHRDEAKLRVDNAYGDNACTTYNDFREMLARDDIDAVCIAVPDHWHVLIGMEAARRGKAMYYEKPMSLTVEEAQAMRATARRYHTIFQFGTQQRSDARYRFAVELARNGYLGELDLVVASSASYDAEPNQPEQPVPDGLDYDLWLGPAPEAPFTPLRCTRNWTLIRDYSLGCLGGAYGIHNVDIAQWVMDADDSGPIAVEGTGSVPDEGIFDTIQYFEAEHIYPNGKKLIHIDHRSAADRFPQFNVEPSMALLIQGSEGWVYVARGYMDAEPKALLRTVIGPNDLRLPRSPSHWRNFIDAVKRGTDPICPVGPGVKSEIVCQQAEIAIRLGRPLQWDNELEQFINDPEANRMLSSPMRHPWHL